MESEANSIGWLEGVLRRSSPFFDARPAGETISVAVIHFISLPAGEYGGDEVDRLFTGRMTPECPDYASLKGLRVSSHFFIRRTGETLQYVNLFERAWHAGLSNFRGRNAVNDFSVGIELEGCGEEPFEDAQYQALGGLLDRLSRILPLRFATGHETIAPGRKNDPGPFFDWMRLSRMLPSGMSIATAPEDCDREMLSRRMAELGLSMDAQKALMRP